MPLRPPRLPELLLRLALRREHWREETLGDLHEEFAAQTMEKGAWKAQLWYWREAIHVLRSSRHDAPVTTTPPSKDFAMFTWLTEARLAARSLARRPLVSLAIIGTLALGLGANAATFGMIDSLLLRPFTIPNIDRLVVLSELSADNPFPQEAVAPANYEDLRRRPSTTIQRFTTVNWWDVNFSGGDTPERVQGSMVGVDFFAILGISPADGRYFLANDDGAGARVVVISDGLWKRRFGGTPSIVGSVVRLDGEPYTIVGRTPEGFGFPNGSDFWTPLVLSAEDRAVRTSRHLTVIGELAPGATVDQAQAEMTAAYAALKEAHQDANRAFTLVVQPFTRAMVDFGLPTILTLWQVAALFLLIIAGTNIASLFLARGAERQRELAVRLAIGASRWRVIRQLLIESVVLSIVAVPLALLVAWGALVLIKSLMPGELLRFVPGWTTMGVNPRIALATAGLALLSAMLFGLLPALRASDLSLTSSLKDGGRASTSGLGKSRLRRGLVVAEVALTIPLLLSAGLAAIAGQRLSTGPQGFDPDGLVRVRLDLPTATYADAQARRVVTARLLEETLRTPGVTAAATTSVAPATAANQRRRVVVEGFDHGQDGPTWTNTRAVSADFFSTLRIPILDGRAIAAGDRHDTQLVAVVSKALADRYWPGDTPVGKRLKLSADDPTWITVVGISGNVIDDWFSSRNAPTVYVPVEQRPSSEVHILARGVDDPVARIAALRQAVARVDSSLPAFDVGTMPGLIRTRTTGLRLVGQLMAAFGLLSLILACAGIYSVMAHFVSQRRHEIGVRMALGASSRQVLTLTLAQGLRLAGMGIAIGLALGVMSTQFMEDALFGVVAFEWPLFVAVPTILGLVAAAATLVPARSALSVSPASALRD